MAAAALDAGFALVNDVTAGRADPALLPTVAHRGAAVCLMHMRGDPRTMQDDPRYGDVVGEVRDHLAARLAAAVDAGVPEERVLLDPGIGFGKTLEHNLALLAGLPGSPRWDARWWWGSPARACSARSSAVRWPSGCPPRLAAGLAAVARGAAVLRVHDVRETVDALAVWTAVEAAEER